MAPLQSIDFTDTVAKAHDRVLVTGAAGFIGERVIERLLAHGFRNVRCLVRPSSNSKGLQDVARRFGQGVHVEIVTGNLMSRDLCTQATEGVVLIYHLAAGTGISMFPDAYMNSVVTTRNLLDATVQHRCLRRVVIVSSFSVYTNKGKPRGRWLDESCPIEQHAHLRGDAYCFAKVKQEEIVKEYGEKRKIPYVIVRPGVVYGPGKKGLPGRIGINTFGRFLHLGGSNEVPLTYVDNCADAIILAGLKREVEGEVFNIVDDDLPSSRRILRRYKREVKEFKSVYLPRVISYLMFWAWERYSDYSKQQLPPVFNRRAWHAYWKGSRYTNGKLKRVLGWCPKVSTSEGLNCYMQYSRAAIERA